MWLSGFLDLSPWQLMAVTLVLTHIIIVSVTVYLYRYPARRVLNPHPALQHFFRLWLWLTTGVNTRGRTAIHYKHHAKCETVEDPHSLVHKGLLTVLCAGTELYKAEAKNQDILRIYGKNCPDDWIERNPYSRFPIGGVVLMVLIDLVPFGALGLTAWAVQMAWILFWATGMVNGLDYAAGYHNFERRDAVTNLVPWDIFIGGEELHNNHYTYLDSAKLLVKKWEFDLDWVWIKLFSFLRLARVVRVAPIVHRIGGKHSLDMDTAMATLNSRFQIMAQYRELVIAPLIKQEVAKADESVRHLFHRTKCLLSRETSLLQDRHHVRIDPILTHSQVLKVTYEKRLALQQIWARASANGHDMLATIKDWVHKAEASGIQSSKEFAVQLKTYSLRPT